MNKAIDLPNNELILLQCFTVQALRHVKVKHSLYKGQFDLLLCAQGLQYSNNLPYYTCPAIMKLLPVVSPTRLYEDNKYLLSLEYVRPVAGSPRSRKAILYQVTGVGMAVIKSYTNKLRSLISMHQQAIEDKYKD